MKMQQLNDLKKIDTENKKHEAIETLYLLIEDYIDHSDYIFCDLFISEFLKHKFSFGLHIALLTVTFKIKDHLNKRNQLFNKANIIGNKLYSKEDTDIALYGLK